MPSRPDPRPEARNCVVLVLDSCRYDSFMAAAPRWIPRLGEVQRRQSYASWTSPSHYNLLMGLLPHRSPTHVFASEVYKKDLARWTDRLGTDSGGFVGMLPRIWMPHHLRHSLGYRVHAQVSMPVLNPATPLAVDFDSYVLAERHNDLDALLDQVHFSDERPTFWLINTGETHYPYATPDEPEHEWPRIHGLHGVFKRVAEGQLVHESEAPRFFDQDKLDTLRARQIQAVTHVDGVVERLFDLVPAGTHIIITSDHGELFGEAGYFGHGPIQHEKVFEVPFVEGRIR